jgi:hypothetical protein
MFISILGKYLFKLTKPFLPGYPCRKLFTEAKIYFEMWGLIVP